MTTEDEDQIREALERLKNSSMEIGKAIYSQSNDSGSQEEPQQEEPKQEEKQNEEPKKEEEKKWEIN